MPTADSLPDDLAALLALWRERYPRELHAEFRIDRPCRYRFFDFAEPTNYATAEGFVVDGDEAWGCYDRFLIEGHARACIRKAGYFLTTHTYGDGSMGAEAERLGDDGGPCLTEPRATFYAGGANGAIALAKLRLVLPHG